MLSLFKFVSSTSCRRAIWPIQNVAVQKVLFHNSDLLNAAKPIQNQLIKTKSDQKTKVQKVPSTEGNQNIDNIEKSITGKQSVEGIACACSKPRKTPKLDVVIPTRDTPPSALKQLSMRKNNLPVAKPRLVIPLMDAKTPGNMPKKVLPLLCKDPIDALQPKKPEPRKDNCNKLTQLKEKLGGSKGRY